MFILIIKKKTKQVVRKVFQTEDAAWMYADPYMDDDDYVITVTPG